MPAGSGDVAAVAFTAPIDGVLHVTVTFRLEGMASSGGTAQSRLFFEQGGVRQWSPVEVLLSDNGLTWEKKYISLQGKFTVAAGLYGVAGLWSSVVGAAAANWHEMQVFAALHKRGS